MSEYVWIFEVGSQDPECYAEGTDNTVRVYATRESAIAAAQKRFPGQQLDIAPAGASYGRLAELEVTDEDGEHRGLETRLVAVDAYAPDWPEDTMLQWEWAIYSRPVNP